MEGTALTPEEKITELTNLLEEHKTYWRDIVTDLSSRLRKLESLADLEAEIHIRCHEASEYCANYSVTLARKSYEYKKKLGDAVYAYKTAPENLMKVRTDSYITSQVERDLAFDKYVIDIMDAHTKHMMNIYKNLCDIKYAIQNRIHIEEITRGIK